MSLSHAISGFGFWFGEAAGVGPCPAGAPVLAGEATETAFAGARAAAAGEEAGFALFEQGEWLLGAARLEAPADLDAAAVGLYRGLRRLLRERGLHAARIWNFVPSINADGPGGLENYRAFCRGRAEAWDEAGDGVAPPAASAVGSRDGALVVAFAASRTAPVTRENPEQIPAYEYPPEHGPRPPSFSRAAQVVVNGRRHTFVSGTAAIKGHLTVAPGELDAQISCTLDNLRLISGACGLGERLGAGSAPARHFKIYLRHPADLAATRAALASGRLLAASDRVSWLHADICRAALRLEIEATVVE